MLGLATDTGLQPIGPLPSPKALRASFPLAPAAARTVYGARQQIRDILHGRDPSRLVVVVGPYSIHDPDAAFEYAERLKHVADATSGQLVVVMRTFVEKPRSSVGWKGLVNDPLLDGSCEIERGLELARKVLLAINALGVPCASELLDPCVCPYLEDLLGWAVIGARTTESQPHRQLASGLSMPVGLKNGTSGSLEVALNAMVAASEPQSYLGLGLDGLPVVIRSRGNPDLHIVLRGGGGHPNHDADFVDQVAALARRHGSVRPVWVDCSHDNSQRDHRRQGLVSREVLRQVQRGQQAIGGLLLESNLEAGRQPWTPGAPLARGVSMTDGCMGWSETEELLHELAHGLEELGPGGRSPVDDLSEPLAARMAPPPGEASIRVRGKPM